MRPTRSYQYRLRSALVVIALVAVLFATGRSIYLLYTSVRLSDAVASFNSNSLQWPTKIDEPRLSEAEIVDAIESQLPTLNATESTRNTYRTIARTRRLPRTAQLCGFQVGGDETHWIISLEVMTGAKSGYALGIRDTKNAGNNKK